MTATNNLTKYLQFAPAIIACTSYLVVDDLEQITTHDNFNICYSKHVDTNFENENYIKYIDNKNYSIDFENIIKSLSYLDARVLEIESPNKLSIENALKVYKILHSQNVKIHNISPSPDGGIIFEFRKDTDYQLFEITNYGTFMYTSDKDGEISSRTFKVDELENIIYSEFNEYAFM